MHPVLEEMLLELHSRLLHLRRALDVSPHATVLTRFYAVDGMFHTLEEELRDGAYHAQADDSAPPDQEPEAS